MMAAVLKFIVGVVKFFGPVAVTLALTIAYYEGVPGLRDIPFVDKLPIVREFIVGRVQLQRSLAAEAATERLVSRTELKTVQAYAASLKRQVDDFVRFAAEARKQEAIARLERDRANSDLEKRIAKDSDPDVSRWRQHDFDRLSEQRSSRPP